MNQRLQSTPEGVVYPTDMGWYVFLREESRRLGGGLEEVNFWRPSGGRLRLAPGAPFFFKLKAPHNVVAGFGSFGRGVRAPVWLAWDSFGRANGAADLPTLRSMIGGYVADETGQAGARRAITCLMIEQPVFFDDEDWIEQPEDWKHQTVSGKYYDLTSGPGRMLFDRCRLLEAKYRARSAAPESVRRVLLTDRFGQPTIVRPRLGQHSFRLAVTGAYDGACAVTGEHSLPALQAVHITSYAGEGTHDVTNGLLLRADVHQLYDKGYVTVTPDYAFRVSRRLYDEFRNGRSYRAHDGRPIERPKDTADWPDRAALERHMRETFRD